MVDKSTPRTGGKTATTREDRLKAALKANLQRRKAQSRVRAQSEEGQNSKPDSTGQDKDA